MPTHFTMQSIAQRLDAGTYSTAIKATSASTCQAWRVQQRTGEGLLVAVLLSSRAQMTTGPGDAGGTHGP